MASQISKVGTSVYLPSNKPKLPIALGIMGILVVVAAGVLGWVVVPKIIDDKIEEQVRLINGTDTWDKWQSIPFETFMTFYVYNITNPDQVEAGEKPIFVEKGPYTYEQKRERVDITQDQEDTGDTDDSVQYFDQKTYWFRSDKSEGNTEEDLVNIINVPLVAVLHGVRSRLPVLVPVIANGLLFDEKFIRRNVKVGELLFEGFDVSLYTKSILAPLLPEEFEGGRFGLYKGENGTKSKRFNIYTGVHDHTKFGEIITYDGKTTLGFWNEGTECDKVKGTDGTVYPPFFTKDRKIDVFVTDLCRSLRLEFEEEVKVKDITAYRFTVPPDVLEDPRTNEENRCYCLNEKLEDCPKSAAMSLEGCRNGAPIMMSTPYFLDGDKGYSEDSGLEDAIRIKHFTHLDMEPNTGVILDAHKRIQVNIDFKLLEGVIAYEGLKKDILFPVMWVDENGTIDDKSADEVKSKLLTPLKLVNILKWTILGLGIALFLAGVALFYIKRKRSQKTV